MSLEDNLKSMVEALKADVRAEFTAVEAKHLVERIRQLEDENQKLREALAKSADINPYGSIENAQARDMARSLLYQVPALPLHEEDNRIVEDLVRKHRAENPEAKKLLPLKLTDSEAISLLRSNRLPVEYWDGGWHLPSEKSAACYVTYAEEPVPAWLWWSHGKMGTEKSYAEAKEAAVKAMG